VTTEAEPEHWATCAWCRRTVPLGEAIDEGWLPEWWHGDVAHGPACPSCAAKHLEDDCAGEMVLRPGHALPEGET
jgi:hypothetical protein